jgi:hypothetical protein
MTRSCAAIVVCLMLTGCSPRLPSFGLSDSPPGPAATLAGAPPLLSSVKGDAACKAQDLARRRSEQLVVAISTTFSNGAAPEYGAGLLLSIKGATATILTAAHVVKKAGAGKPTIGIQIEGADGATHKVAGEVSARFAFSSSTYGDIAILQADLSRLGATPNPDWDVLRPQKDSNDVKDFVVIGNPAGRGKQTTPKGDAEYKSSRELRINAGVMEQGYSGGGAFDGQRRLAGLVFEDGGQYAAAYPIEPVLGVLRTAGVPIDLKQAPNGQRNIYLSTVDGTSPELKQSGADAFAGALQGAGFEPGCLTPGAYKLTIYLKGTRTSATSSEVEVIPSFVGPEGAPIPMEKERISFIHMIGRPSIYSVEALQEKVRKTADALAEKLAQKVAGS